MILCLSERVSEGDAEFLGFCRRWNKWEGQPPYTGRAALTLDPSTVSGFLGQLKQAQLAPCYLVPGGHVVLPMGRMLSKTILNPTRSGLATAGAHDS